MLVNNELVGFGSAVAEVEFSYLGLESTLTNNSVYTFSGASIGASDPKRVIVCVVLVDSVTLGNTIVNSLTVAGVSGTKIVEDTDANGALTSIWTVAVPLGETGDIVVTLSQAMQNCSVAKYRCTNISTTAFATATDSTGNPSSITINIPANGVCIAGNVVDGVASGSVNWTGLTERDDAVVETCVKSTAGDKFSAAQTSYAVQSSHTGGGTIHTLCVASFSPTV